MVQNIFLVSIWTCLELSSSAWDSFSNGCWLRGWLWNFSAKSCQMQMLDFRLDFSLPCPKLLSALQSQFDEMACKLLNSRYFLIQFIQKWLVKLKFWMRMWQFQVWFKHFFDSMHQIITNSRVIFVPTPTKICDKGLLDGGLSAADIGCKDEMRKKISKHLMKID